MFRSNFKSLLAAAVVLTATVAGARENPECMLGRGEVRRTIQGHRLSILPATLKNPPYGDFEGCRAVLSGSSGKRKFAAEAFAIALYETDKDIDGDGTPDVVLEGYSGGAHCCWTYWILSLKRAPTLRAEIENERGIAFDDRDGDGKIEIWALDGVFDYFDGLSHGETVFPSLVLKLQGTRLEDISHRFLRPYDEEIREARGRLASLPIAALQEARTREQLYGKAREAIPSVLEIVLAYLYSGRELEAWKALREYWPANDYSRMRRLIEKTRRAGLLRYVSRPSRVPASPR